MNTRRPDLIVVLDQTVGELWAQDGRATGVHLWPAARATVDRLIESGYSLALAIPRLLDAGELAAVRRSLPTMTVDAEGSVPAVLHRLVDQGVRRPLVVAVDRRQREEAQRLGCEPIPHLGTAEWALGGKRLHFARARTGRRPDSKTAGLLPYWLERDGDSWLVVGLFTDEARLAMIRHRAAFEPLAFDYRVGDCALLWVDDPAQLTDAHLERNDLLLAEPGRLLLALYGAEVGEGPAPPSGHGALEQLVPSPELLAPPVAPGSFTRRAASLAAALEASGANLMLAAGEEAQVPQRLATLPTAATWKADADRYGGRAPLDAGGPIISRHISHSGNQRAVQALLSDLNGLGFCAFTHSFTYGGKQLSNVIADLPGRGLFRIRPDLLKKLLKVLRSRPYPWPWPALERELERSFGHAGMAALREAADGHLRPRMEELLASYSWLPWWRFEEYALGFGAQIIIVGAHLDSAGERTPGGYRPEVDPAPGMDDNASGIATCLAAARYLRAFKGKLLHTVRLCLFNAEEAGLVGSKAYAAYLKAVQAPVKAVICADMTGYNSDANRIFEIHAGFTDPAVRDASLPLARTLATWAASLGALQPAQIYQGTSPWAGAPDRGLYDPAINRSDHSAFHQQGFPAVAVTEDYFANLATEPGKDPNPNYHTAADTVVDPDYGAAIAAAVACTAKELAE